MNNTPQKTEAELDAFIREKAILANPSLDKCIERSCMLSPCKGESHRRPLQLADILLAIGDEPVNFFYYSTGEIRMDYLDKDDKEIQIYWNLTLPYSQQSLEVKLFIAELLGINQ